MIHVYTFGSASLFSNPGLASLTHYISIRDPVPFASPIAYLKARAGKRPDVQFLPAKSGSLIEHGLLESYDVQLEAVTDRILKTIDKP